MQGPGINQACVWAKGEIRQGALAAAHKLFGSGLGVADVRGTERGVEVFLQRLANSDVSKAAQKISSMAGNATAAFSNNEALKVLSRLGGVPVSGNTKREIVSIVKEKALYTSPFVSHKDLVLTRVALQSDGRYLTTIKSLNGRQLELVSKKVWSDKQLEQIVAKVFPEKSVAPQARVLYGHTARVTVPLPEKPAVVPVQTPSPAPWYEDLAARIKNGWHDIWSGSWHGHSPAYAKP